MVNGIINKSPMNVNNTFDTHTKKRQFNYARTPKGKIERFFRTVREQFLLVCEEQKPASLQELNDRLHRWIEDEYHQTPHHGIDNESPLSQWSRSMDRLRLAESQDWLDQKF